MLGSKNLGRQKCRNSKLRGRESCACGGCSRGAASSADAILAVVLAFLLGEAGGRLGFDFPTVAAIATALSWLAGLAWGLFVVRMALKKNYKEFRLALVAKS